MTALIWDFASLPLPSSLWCQGSFPHPAQGKETQYMAMLLEQKLATVEGHHGGMGG